MRLQNLVATAVLVGSAACSGQNVTTGMRFDGVKVECTQTGDDVNRCAPVSPADPCDAANVLWPPNHKMIEFTLSACAPAPGCGGGGDGPDAGSGSDDGDAGIIFRTVTAHAAPSDTAKVTSITVDEAVDVGKGGDGHTPKGDLAQGDVELDGDGVTFALRSERQGGGDGRVYRVHFADDTGATGSCEFQVPHDQGPAHGAVDSGTVVTLVP